MRLPLRLRTLALLAVLAAPLGCNDGAAEARALRATCDDGNGDAAACNALGIQMLRGEQILSDWRRAAELFEFACDGGVPEGCVRLGWMFLHFRADDRGLRVDSARATDYYERACEDGASLGCVGLAEMYLEADSIIPDDEDEPTGPLQDLSRAAELMTLACDAGEMLGCVRLGILHRDSVGVDADPARAAELFARACDADSPLGCAYLGHALETGTGIPQDLDRAAALYQETCEESEEMTGCFFLGGLTEHGVIVTQDYEKAAELYVDGCLGTVERDEGSPGVAESCFRAAELMVTGSAGENQRYRSINFYRRACNMGYGEACEREG